MCGLRWRLALLFSCAMLLAACDAASPTLSPFPNAVPLAATSDTGSVTATDLPPAVTATAAPPITPLATPPAGKYLFIEIWYEADGNGNLPRQTIEFPTYAFDVAKGSLAPTAFSRGRPISVHPGDWGLVGSGARRSGSAGSGLGSGLERLSVLPYTTTVTLPTGKAGDGGESTRKAVVNLQGVADDGRLEALIDGERVVLTPGAHWQRKITVGLSTATHQGQYDLSATLTNYGWLDQSRIQSGP